MPAPSKTIAAIVSPHLERRVMIFAPTPIPQHNTCQGFFPLNQTVYLGVSHYCPNGLWRICKRLLALFATLQSGAKGKKLTRHTPCNRGAHPRGPTKAFAPDASRSGKL